MSSQVRTGAASVRRRLGPIGLFLTLRGVGNGAATGYMFGVVAFFSLIPIVVALGDGGKSPFLFNAAWRVGLISGVTVSGLLYLFLFHRGLLAYYWENRETIVSQVPNALLLLSVVNGFDYALFALSVRFIDVSVAAVLFEIWPIFFVLLRARLEKQQLPLSVFILLIPAMVGLAFVVLSQTEFGKLAEGLSFKVLLGGVLAFCGGLASACTALSFKWASDLQRNLPEPDIEPNPSTGVATALVPVLVAFVVTNLVAFPLTIAVGISSGERLALDSSGATYLAVGLLGGALVQALGSKLYRISNVISHSLGVNAIYYFTPCFTLLWLALIGLLVSIGGWELGIGGINVAHVELLIIGTILIVIANLLINFPAEGRWSFKALVLSLGGCGALVYLRGSLFDGVGIANWSWAAGDYFGSVALAATIFTLLLAFRVARLVTRTNDEENRAFGLLRTLDMLAKKGVINPDVRNCILVIDRSNKQEELRDNYFQVRRYIAEAAPENDADRQLLAQMESGLDSLVRSNQATPVLGEIFALFVFAGITVFVSMFTKPEVSEGWIRLLVDMFAMLISSVVIFLMMYSIDLDHERDAEKLALSADGGDFVLTFPVTVQRQFDQWLSITVGVMVILSFFVLLGHKWMGWFG